MTFPTGSLTNSLDPSLSVTSSTSTSLFSVRGFSLRPFLIANFRPTVGWDLVESLLWYLFGVETQGRTLEELEEIFSAPNPVAASKAKRTIAIKETGDVVVVDGA